MKKKLFIATLFALFSLTACGTHQSSSSSESSADSQIMAVYNAYLDNGGTLSYEDWLATIKGEDGRGIIKIELASSEGNVDTYTIIYSDGTTSTFTVTNGTDGSQGIQGEKGEDGHTPTITIGENGNWFVDGVDTGIAAQGQKGDKGEKGDAGADGQDGADGTSMRTGEGVPGASLGQDGDSYVDLSTWDYYVKENGSWVLKGNIKGDTGVDAPHHGETCKVTFHLNGGTMPEGVGIIATVVWGDTLDLPVPTYHGHVFEGWFTGEGINLHRQWYSTDAVFSDVHLYADWSIGTYTLTLDLDGGSFDGATSYSYQYGSYYSLPTSGITKKGFKFTGWTLDGVSFTNFGTYTYEDITLKAAYDETQERTIHLDLNGGTYDGATSITVVEFESYTLPSEGVTYEDKVFAGWYNNEEKWDFVGVYELEEDVWLTAKWEDLITYPLSIDLNGGSLTNGAESYITNKHIYSNICLSVPTKEGFDFLGYYNGRMRLTDENGFIVNKGILTADSANSIVAKYIASDGSLSGDYIYFGEYPQTMITEASLVSSLADATDTDGDGYLNYGGKEYAMLDNIYVISGLKYFEVEPILWEIRDDGELFSSMIIDGVKYQTDSSDRVYRNMTIYANNYQYSNIRAFLNGYDGSDYGVEDYTGKGFIDVAFNFDERTIIRTTKVDNSAATTNNPINPYISPDTNDKVYLLSCQEADSLSTSEKSLERMKEPTDYAICKGATMNETTKDGDWSLRSPRSTHPFFASGIGQGGFVGSGNVKNSDGLVPVLKIAL